MVKYQILPLCSCCNSYDVRESSDLSTIETLIGLFGIRPYRCKKCGERSEYNYYFREGFRRGYEDGYNSRYRYGRYANDNYFMSDNILSQILNFESIR